MILLSLLCCVLGVSALQPRCAALQQETRQQVVDSKGKKNAFVYFYNAYYSYADIGKMLPYSIPSINDIENFGGSGNTGDYVLNHTGKYDFDSSFIVSNSVYEKDNNDVLSLSVNQLVGVSFITTKVDYDYTWVFYNTVGGQAYDYYVRCVKTLDYRNGDTYTSWSYDTYVLRPNNNYNTSNQKDVSLYYVYFNLNTWGQYFTYPDEDLIFNQGYASGYEYGFIVGQDKGYAEGLADSYDTGYQAGYSAGYDDGVNVDDTASTIFTGILEVGLLPVNVFLGMFNYEVFGVNIAGIVSSLMTVAIVVIIFRFLFGGKKDD